MLLAAWPRLAVLTQAPAYFGPRGRLAYVLGWGALLFGLRQWGFPALRRHAEAFERATRELRAELGREPLPDEVGRRLRSVRAAAGRG